MGFRPQSVATGLLVQPGPEGGPELVPRMLPGSVAHTFPARPFGRLARRLPSLAAGRAISCGRSPQDPDVPLGEVPDSVLLHDVRPLPELVERVGRRVLGQE